VNRSDLQKLALIRLDEAETLLKAGKYDGAYYLGGYVVECALKACIAKRTKRHEFPDKKLANQSWTHDLDTLVKAAQLDDPLDAARKSDPVFAENRATVKEWSEEARYRRKTRLDVRELLAAITDDDHGILPWLKTRW
jgi:HEPN domain-containing protein